jgi:ABC-type uncharacterized transport system substrate-binding protein
MASVLRAMEERAQALQVKLRHMEVRRLDELATAFAAAKAQAEALTAIDDGLYIANVRRVAELSLKHQLPGIGFTEYAEAGGLLAYGVDFRTCGGSPWSWSTRSSRAPSLRICPSCRPRGST